MAQGLIQWLFLELISLLVGEFEKEAGLLNLSRRFYRLKSPEKNTTKKVK